MVRSFKQSEAFLSQIIPREASSKACQIMSDKRNYLASKEFENVQHTFINSSKNLRQLIDDDKYSLNGNRCKLFMEYKNGMRNDLAAQLDYEAVLYFCTSLHVVTRTRVINQGIFILVLLL